MLKTQEKDMKPYLNETTNKKLLKSAEKELRKMEKEHSDIEGKYQKIERFLYTLKTIAPNEYDYFETLKDSEGDNVKINIDFNKKNNLAKNNSEIEGRAHTFINPDLKLIKIGENNRNRIVVGVVDNEINMSLFEENLVTLGNELGDIKYFFENVKTYDDAKEFFKYANGFTDFKGYETKGTGKYSFDYEKMIKEVFKKYIKDNKVKNEEYNSGEQTLKIPNKNE